MISLHRTYYAMFYLAEACLLQKSLVLSRHSGVISAFGQHFAKTREAPPEYHRYLIEAQSSRETGDYDTGPGLSATEAKIHMDRAAEFLTWVRSYLPP